MAGMEKVDLNTIAKASGMSLSTVHRALSGKGRVSAATRRRVLKVAARLGYRPNLVARSLRSRRSATLGVVVAGLDSSFYAHVLEGISRTAQEQDYAVVLACSYGDGAKERDLVELLLGKQVDGLIVQPADNDQNCSYYAMLIEQQAHLVFIDRYLPGVNVDSVCTDNRLGGYLAGQHLADLGRKAVCVLMPSAEEAGASSIRERTEGLTQALKDNGLRTVEMLEADTDGGADRHECARLTVCEYLDRQQSFDALFAAQDGLAVGALEALRSAGRSVPEDVSVIGFDDQDLCAYTYPALTTIHQPMREIGCEAAALVFRRLEQGSEPMPRQRINLEPRLVVRGSCGGTEKAPSSE